MARAALGDKAQTGNRSTSISSVQPLFAHVLPALKRKREAGLLLLQSIGLVMVCHDNIKRVSASVKLENVPFQTQKIAKLLSASRGIQAQARLCQLCMPAAHNKSGRLPSSWTLLILAKHSGATPTKLRQESSGKLLQHQPAQILEHFFCRGAIIVLCHRDQSTCVLASSG